MFILASLKDWYGFVNMNIINLKIFCLESIVVQLMVFDFKYDDSGFDSDGGIQCGAEFHHTQCHDFFWKVYGIKRKVVFCVASII